MLHYVVTQSGLNHKTENAEEAQIVPDGSTLHVFVDFSRFIRYPVTADLYLQINLKL